MFWLRLAVPAIVVSLTGCLDSSSLAPDDDDSDRAVAVAEAEAADGDDAVAVVLDAPRPVPPAVVVIPCRTTWPAGGAVGTQLRRLADEVELVTDGRVELRWFFNASSDSNVVGQLRRDGGCALLSATGVAALAGDHMILAMPGLFANWNELDAGRDAARGHLQRALADSRFLSLAELDIGAARILGTEAAAVPADLRRGAVAMVGHDPIMIRTASGIGFSTRELALGEVPTHLGRDVTHVVISAFQAEQLQWTSRVTHYLDQVVPWFETGGLVIASATFATLDADDGEQLQDLADVHLGTLSAANRLHDVQARRRLVERTVVATPSPAQRAAWAAALGEARADLLRRLSPRVVEQVCARVRC